MFRKEGCGMRLGIVQALVDSSKEVNLTRAEDNIRQAVEGGADIVVLGEMFNCPYHNAAFVANAEPREGRSVERLSAAAAKHGVYLVGGSIPLLENEKIYNASFVFDRTGRVIAVHKKVHLFDIAIDGGQVFRDHLPQCFHIHGKPRILLCRRLRNVQFLPHISRQVFVCGDIPCRLRIRHTEDHAL